MPRKTAKCNRYRIVDYTCAPAPTFDLPPDSIRKRLLPGEYAKLVFLPASEQDTRPGERMWVRIRKTASGGTYVGELDNAPITLPLERGERIKFLWKHVIAVMR